MNARRTILLWAVLTAVAMGPDPAPAASERNPGGHRCEPGGEITALFRHRQERERRARSGEALSAEPRAPLPDIGNIAIVDDSEGAVLRPKDRKSVV